MSSSATRHMLYRTVVVVAFVIIISISPSFARPHPDVVSFISLGKSWISLAKEYYKLDLMLYFW